MRRFAWVLIVVGVLIALAWPVYVTTMKRSAIERHGPAVARRSEDSVDWPGIPGGPWQQERAIALREIDQALALSPWTGVITGALVTAFGVLLLAIRRPDAQAMTGGSG